MRGRGIVATLVPVKSVKTTLPVVGVRIDGMKCSALVDTGCSKTIVSTNYCRAWSKRDMDITTIDGTSKACCGVGVVTIHTGKGDSAKIDVLVTRGKPLGYDLLLGIDAIRALGGAEITSNGRVMLGKGEEFCAALSIEEPDFCASFDHKQRVWTARWKWAMSEAPKQLHNVIPEYSVPDNIKTAYEEELEMWMANGWLIPYPRERLGPPKGLIPLMAIVQPSKNKVRPVMDYRELNKHVDAFTANADVCAAKLREWRQQGSNVALLDLKRAYLQIHVHESLWAFQTVIVKGKRYCLTRLGFGLNVAPLIMKAIVNAVLTQEEPMRKATSAYVDDIYVNEDVMSADKVRRKLETFGLTSKDPKRLKNGATVLGLEVWWEHGTLRWKRGGPVPEVPNMLTRRIIFSVCGKLVGHFPVCKWLRAATGVIKRRASAVTREWDDTVDDVPLKRMMAEVVTKVCQDDPTRGDWCVAGRELNAWVDASSLATGVVLERDGAIVEDACWLRPTNDAQHINLAELDATLKGLNLALQWHAEVVHLHTDSLCVYHWLTDTLTGKARVRAKFS